MAHLRRKCLLLDLRSNVAFRLLGIALGLIGISGYLAWATHGGLVRDGNWVGVDFHTYYQTAQVLRRGEDIYRAGIAPPYVYPPLLAILVLPLAALPVAPPPLAWHLLQP